MIIKVFPHKAMKVTHDEKMTFTFNGQYLKHFVSRELIGKRSDHSWSNLDERNNKATNYN